MFAIAINYLNNRVMAAAYGSPDGSEPEWPPHPDRVFMSLVAAWGQTGQDRQEELALRWLERLPHPSIAAGKCRPRQAVTSYVPVNDTPSRKNRGRLLPQNRIPQPRYFPSAALDNPVAHLIWPDAEPEEHLQALQRVCASVTNVGHSTSLAQAYVENNPPSANWLPRTAPGGHQMRVPYAGRLDDLIVAYGNGQKPVARRWIGYSETGEAELTEKPHSAFNPELIVFEATGTGLDLHAAARISATFRNFIMAKCPDPVPEWISGHTPDGAPSHQPHMAILPLPFVGSQYADGHIMGLAVAIPRGMTNEEAGYCLSELTKREEDGRPSRHAIFSSEWNRAILQQIEAYGNRRLQQTLRPRTWTGPARTWHTVTPVTIDRYYKGPDKARLERENVTEQCRRIGLPTPATVVLGQHSMLEGVPPAREFTRLKRRSDRGGNGEWQHTHAVIVFAEPVQGPVIIGSGRYRGYGLCRPQPE